MPRTVTVGLDGSPESRAAAEWAAREAKLRGLPVRLVHVREAVPESVAQSPLLGAETDEHWAGRILRESAQGLRLRHPGVEVTVEQTSGSPAEALCAAAKDAELLALGSRGLGGVGGFLVGSVGMSVVAHAERPVVLVRAGEQAADEHEMDPAGVPSAATAFRPVVLGLDTGAPDETLLEFAFDAAARRATSLRVVHGWRLLPCFGVGPVPEPDLRTLERDRSTALSRILRPWRQKFPAVEVVEVCRLGSAAEQLVDASHQAGLVVVGRRVRRAPFGTRIGHVTHAVLHHAAAPVAVVAHG
ncbi:universal stress protein [Streptomyces sp. NPDC046831]|uniref:universal stress protein n=1 Tax=Streptomyces sp. NPDC046831 TaxID=3154805 RepID=UPI0033D3C671